MNSPESEQLPARNPNCFGVSLHLDFYDVTPALCDNLAFFYTLLEDLVQHLGMQKQSPPFLFRSDDFRYPSKAGLSGWVPLIESGISVHTLTRQGFVTIDLFTCGDLDVKRTTAYLAERLAPSRFERHHLVRGSQYGPRS